MKKLYGQRAYVQSAGVKNDMEVDGFSISVCQELGIELSRHRSRSFEEMQEWGDAPDQWFNVHLGLMAVSYSTQASGGAKVEPLGDTGNAEQEAKLASKAENIMKTRVVKGLPFMNFHQAYDRLKAEPGWNGID